MPAYIDFFTASIQVSIANNSIFCGENLLIGCVVGRFRRLLSQLLQNVGEKISADCSQIVIDLAPMLCNLLQSEDKMVFLVANLTDPVLNMYVELC